MVAHDTGPLFKLTTYIIRRPDRFVCRQIALAAVTTCRESGFTSFNSLYCS